MFDSSQFVECLIPNYRIFV